MSSEKRRQRREFCSSKIAYELWGNGDALKVENARCSDVGPTGMCIYSPNELLPGAILKVSMPNCMNTTRVAVVRWVEKLDESLFRAGLAFM